MKKNHKLAYLIFKPFLESISVRMINDKYEISLNDEVIGLTEHWDNVMTYIAFHISRHNRTEHDIEINQPKNF